MTGRVVNVRGGNIDIVPIEIVIGVWLVDIVTRGQIGIRAPRVTNALVVDIVQLDKNGAHFHGVNHVRVVHLGNIKPNKECQVATIVHPVSMVVVVVALVGIEYKMSINRT